jgi:hypothetical protein
VQETTTRDKSLALSYPEDTLESNYSSWAIAAVRGCGVWLQPLPFFHLFHFFHLRGPYSIFTNSMSNTNIPFGPSPLP